MMSSGLVTCTSVCSFAFYERYNSTEANFVWMLYYSDEAHD